MSSLALTTSTTVLNPNEHDLVLDDSGQLEWIGGEPEDQPSYARMIAQRVICRVRMVRAEWYQDQRLGTPWRERLWRKGVTVDVINRVMRDVLNGTPGIRQVESLTSQIDAATRTATIEWTVTTETDRRVSTSELDSPFIIEVPND